MADQPDEPVNLTDLPLSSRSNVPMEVQDATASTSATPFAGPTIAAPKSNAQRQREYRQRIAASRTPAQAAAARKSDTERRRKSRLRIAANLARASGSLKLNTASSSRSRERSNNIQTGIQRKLTYQQRQTLAAEPAETTVQPGDLLYDMDYLIKEELPYSEAVSRETTTWKHQDIVTDNRPLLPTTVKAEEIKTEPLDYLVYEEVDIDYDGNQDEFIENSNTTTMKQCRVMAKKYESYEEMEKLLEDDSCSDLEDEDSDLAFEVCDSDSSEVEDIIEVESDELPNDEEDTENLYYNLEGNENIIFTSKSGFAWNSGSPANRIRAHNIVSSSTGLRDEARDITSIKDAFNLYISSNMLEEITTHTNQCCQRKSDSKQISKSELEAFIGILLASGRCNGRKLSLKKIWTSNPLFKLYFFSAAMSRDKFSYIYSNLRFDDKNNRGLRINLTGDKFEPIRSIYNEFNAACLKYFSPGFYITVDEKLATFRGKCPFRVDMKSKPGRYGIKIWAAADVNTAYILNSQPYTEIIQNRREVNQGERVVTDLVRPFFGTGRGVTADNFFTSIPLAITLLENNITFTGTIRKNKREIPKEFLNSHNREELSTLFGFSDNLTLISYVPKKNTTVTLLSTECHNCEVEEGPKKRPSLILHYNKTKGGVDTGDKMTQQYSCVRATRRWPFRIFLELIDMAVLNAYIIWIHKYPEWRKNDHSRRHHFIEELAMELVKENVFYRKNSGKNFHRHIQHGFELYERAMNGDNVIRGTLPMVTQDLPRGRCRFCPRNHDRKSKTQCNFCTKTICIMHRIPITICLDCKQKQDAVVL